MHELIEGSSFRIRKRGILSILISVLALLATFYQLYLQRTHNEKSLKPLPQIYFFDRDKTISVRIVNNGLGSFIIDRLSLKKNNTTYSSISECLDLDSRSYMHTLLNDSVQRVVLPNAHLTIFETQFEDDEGEADMNHARKQLSPITLKVEGRDIYDNKVTIERDFQWFSRYEIKKASK